jgi:hypothetical protein
MAEFRTEGSMLRAATRLLLIASSAAVGAAAVITLRADVMLGYGVDRAFEAHKAALPFKAGPAAARVANKAEVGDEGYWLAASGLDSEVLFDKRLAVGDRITISGRDGRARTIEVMEIKPVGGPILKIAADAAPVRLMQVTCRVVGAKGAEKEELVRFFIEVEDATPPTLPRPQGQVGRT